MANKVCCAEVSRIEKRKLSEIFKPYKWEERRFSKRLDSCSQLHKNKQKSERYGEDWISLLPDEILVAILSLLTIKEAGKCSILSRRWRYLWTFYTGKFEIDYGESCWDESENLSYVPQILKSYRGSVVDELIIHFPGKSMHSSDIDSWVYFASKNCVRRFELDLTPPFDYKIDIKNHYCFPGVDRILSGCNVAHGVFSSLTCLCLAYVNVTGKVLKHFLATCPFLKELVVRNSHSLKFLKVKGEALRLESLEVYECINLRILKINADNLVSLTYDGKSCWKFC